MKRGPDGLNDKQRRFVKEYATDLNATQACIRAGYSPRTAGAQGSELLKVPKIRELVNKQAQTAADKLGLTHEWVLDQLVETAKYGEREANRLRALELLGKHLALFTEKIEHSGGTHLSMTINGVDMDDLQ